MCKVLLPIPPQNINPMTCVNSIHEVLLLWDDFKGEVFLFEKQNHVLGM